MGQLDLCKLLIKQHCQLDLVDKFGLTVLDIARQSGHTEIVSYLQSLGVSSQVQSMLASEGSPPPLLEVKLASQSGGKPRKRLK